MIASRGPTHGLIRSLLVLVLLAALLGASGCSSIHGLFKHQDPETETLSVEQLYATGHKQLQVGNFERAQNYFKRLNARFPYGPYTEQAQLELIYAQYKATKFEEATATANRFIRTYPTHRHVDYAYYMKALIDFNRDSQLLARIARLDMSARDQGSPRASFNEFADLIRRFPNSRYVPDARQRMIYLREEMARHEVNVGLFYLSRQAYVAAANRGQYVIVNYPQSAYEGDALALMAEAYKRLGQTKLSEDAARVLRQNFPGHPWFKGHWPPKESVLRRLNPIAPGQ
ncbi:MAG: outer membrane protein assembly factor BamD [Proteobacteria bacterium]|nr:outer membrane protein assembly factor BamD [Pseudomonadota bacterium]